MGCDGDLRGARRHRVAAAFVSALVLLSPACADTGARGPGSSVSSPASPAPSARPAPDPDPVVVAAGDIACGANNPNLSGLNPTACQMRATAGEIATIAPQYLLPLGDTQYAAVPERQGVQPAAADYRASYNTSWGAVPVPGMTVRPVPGNHEYGDMDRSDSELANGSTYFANFGPNGLNQLPVGVTGPANDYFSYDIPVTGGSWHLISLDSECNGGVGGCGPGSPQERWLRKDLTAHPNTCILAYWHEPRWGGSTGAAGNTAYSALWSDLVNAHATLVLNGHDHYYQNLTPLDADGNFSPTGVTQFIVGTGGEDLETPPSARDPRVLAQDNQHFGVLKLTLHASSASYAFQTTTGAPPRGATIPCSTNPPAQPRP